MAYKKNALGSNTPAIDLSSTEGKAWIRSVVDRINRLENEKAERVSDIKDIYAETQSRITPQALRAEIKRSREDDKARERREAIEDEGRVIRAALGEFANSPLGQAAIASERH